MSSEVTAWTRRRGFAGVFSVLMVGATLAPIVQNWRPTPQDSFPLSYYPMFSAKREETYRAKYIVGVDQEGKRHMIRYTYAGSGGFNQTRRQIGRYLAEDRGDKLARQIASKIAREKKPPLSEVVTVEIMTGEFRFDDYFHGDKAPLSETVRGSAPVKRGGR